MPWTHRSQRRENKFKKNQEMNCRDADQEEPELCARRSYPIHAQSQSRNDQTKDPLRAEHRDGFHNAHRLQGVRAIRQAPVPCHGGGPQTARRPRAASQRTHIRRLLGQGLTSAYREVTARVGRRNNIPRSSHRERASTRSPAKSRSPLFVVV
jgi:hypothetical protein